MTNIVVYSKANCHYCDMLKAYLNEHKYAYEVKDIADETFLTELKALVPAVRTVPQMFINDYHVGGCRDSIDFLEANQQIRESMHIKAVA